MNLYGRGAAKQIILLASANTATKNMRYQRLGQNEAVERLTRHADKIIQSIAIEDREQSAIDVSVLVIRDVCHDGHNDFMNGNIEHRKKYAEVKAVTYRARW